MFPRVLPLVMALSGALRRFPLVVVAALTATLAAVLSNHAPAEHNGEYARMIMTMIFACPASVAAAFLGELHSRLRWGAMLAGILAVIGVWYVVPGKMDPWLEVFQVRYFMLLLTAIALASLLPSLVTKPEGNWWRVNVGMLNALVLAAILSGIVLLGLEIAVFSIQKLFDLKMEKIPLDIFSFCSLFFGPLAVIALFPPFRGELNTAQSGFVFWGNLCKWALIPLGFLFIGILAVYAVLILVQRRLPNGMVATPVLSLGAYGTAAMLLLQPWREKRSWAGLFARIYPPAFLLASILLFISLEKRVGAYGVTFDRYFALAAGIWLTLAAGSFLVRSRQSVFLVPALLALFSLAAALGPLSAGSTTLRSQTGRLKMFLALSPEEKKKNVQEIRSTLDYLGANFGLSAIERIIGPTGQNGQFYYPVISNQVLKKLGLDGAANQANFPQYYQWDGKNPLPLNGFRLLHVLDSFRGVDLGTGANGRPLQMKVEDGELAFFEDEAKLRSVNLDSLKPTQDDGGVPPMIPVQLEGREFLVIILQAQWIQLAGGARRINSVRSLVLEK